MISVTAGISKAVDELTTVLDQEIELLELKRLQMANLYAAIVERDDAVMETLLEQMEHAQRHQEAVDARMAAIRAIMAKSMGAAPATVRLAMLVEMLPAEMSAAIAVRREKIVDLADRLRKQHMSTSLLLRECSRINRMMLEALLSGPAALTTYGTGGKTEWRSREGLLDTER